jgi:hypothetical protein
LRDIVEASAILTDEEIIANLANNAWNDGLSLCASTMAAEFAKRASQYKAGSTDAEFQWKERVKYYTDFADLARRGGIGDPSPTVRNTDVPEVVPYSGRRRIEHELLGGPHGRRGGFE